MFLFVILLSSGLDMSLPEFEPTTDISGNYVYTEYDSEVDDILVEELADLPDGLTVEEPQDDFIEDEVIEEEHILVDSSFEEVANLRSSNTVTINSTPLANRTISVYNMQIRTSNGNTIYYIPLSAGVEYTLSGVSVIYYSYSLDVYSTIYTQTFSNTFTPESNCYFLSTTEFTVSYVDSSGGGDEPIPDDPSGNDPSGGGSGTPYDDTELLSKIDHIDILLRSILFVSIWKFALPLAMKIRDHIFGLKHE